MLHPARCELTAKLAKQLEACDGAIQWHEQLHRTAECPEVIKDNLTEWTEMRLWKQEVLRAIEEHDEKHWNENPPVKIQSWGDLVIEYPNCSECTALLHPPRPQVDKGPWQYLLTMTTTPANREKGLTEARFRALVEGQITTKTYQKARYAVEHADTNMHAHALVTTTSKLTARNFTGPPDRKKPSFTDQTGMVKIDLVKKDNGIDQYISKETEIKILR